MSGYKNKDHKIATVRCQAYSQNQMTEYSQSNPKERGSTQYRVTFVKIDSLGLLMYEKMVALLVYLQSSSIFVGKVRKQGRYSNFYNLRLLTPLLVVCPTPTVSMLNSPRRIMRKDSHLKLNIDAGEGRNVSKGKAKLRNLPKKWGR